MKYFSPNILDGSVTSAKLATFAVTNVKLAPFNITLSKLSTALVSQGGTIPSSGSVLVALSDFSFFMDAETVDALNMRYTPAVAAVPSASGSAPEFNIKNNAAVARLYDVEWRVISPGV